MPTDIANLVHYMNSQAFEKRPSASAHHAAAPFVTISREAGASGHALAQAIVAELQKERGHGSLQGWRVFDRQICEKLLEDRKLRVSLRQLLSEEYHNAVEDFIFHMVAGSPAQTTINGEIFKTVRTLAMAGKAVIVGRAAACYTRDILGGVHLRLVAPEAERVGAMMAREELSEPEARRRVRALDAARAKMVQANFKRDIGDPLLYDAVLNTAHVPLGDLASLAVSWVKEKSAVLEAA